MLSAGGRVRQPALAAVQDGWDGGRSGSRESVGQTLLQPPWEVEGGWTQGQSRSEGQEGKRTPGSLV